MVDIVSYNKTEAGHSCIVVFDTENDGGSSIQSDDLAILIRWNSPLEILPAIQWQGCWNNWEDLPSDFIVNSSTIA